MLDLTHTEIQVAETRVAQARTEAVRKELTQNANNGRIRAEAIEKAIRDLGGFPDTIGPFLGRAAAAVKALTEQAQPFDEALLGDLALEDQLLDRSRYIKALAVAAKRTDVQELADRLITAHSATVNWLTTVLAEDALGGPAALRRTPLQAAAGTAVKMVNLPGQWSAQSVERVAELLRSAGPAVDDLVRRAQHASEVALKALGASRDAALQSAEAVVRDEGAEQDRGRAAQCTRRNRRPRRRRTADPRVRRTEPQRCRRRGEGTRGPADIRTIIAYEEAHKDRQRLVSAAQTRVADIAQEVVGLS